jgi:hypothetical protein
MFLCSLADALDCHTHLISVKRMARLPSPNARARPCRRLCLAVALLVAARTPVYGQPFERFTVGLGTVESISTQRGVSDQLGLSAELSLRRRAMPFATLGIDLGGVGFVTGEVVCVVSSTPCDSRELSGFGYASLSGRWESSSRIAPFIQASAGEWVGRTTNFFGAPHTTESGFTGATEVGLRVGRVALAAGYRVLRHTPQGRTNLPSLLLRIAF